MAKREKGASTIENRVYLFRDLATAYLQSQGGLLSSSNSDERQRALRALSDLARAACVVADGEDQSPAEVSSALIAGM